MKIILSGGGTGGHIYPAVAVAEALKRRLGGKVDILFVGAEGKMEMEKIPALGYHIIGLPIDGLRRRLCVDNLTLPFKVVRSVIKARKILKRFKADVVVGFGGYASGPILWTAQRMKIPTAIQEQNSYAGMTNKILGRKARRICVAYESMEHFFPARRIVMTGNPLRGAFRVPSSDADLRREAYHYFGLQPDKPTILIVGGSLGTRTLNEMTKRHIDKIVTEARIQLIWQTGRVYEPMINLFMQMRGARGVWRGAFIERMDLAYAAADVIISRSGACTVSELCVAGKPVVFVPSPNVAEDHQAKNARALERKKAAVVIPDFLAIEEAMPAALALLDDPEKRRELSENISLLAVPDAAERVAAEILSLIGSK